jgi:hypothetical protein
VIQPADLALGSGDANRLRHAVFIETVVGFEVLPGETKARKVTCPAGMRLLSGGFEWAGTERDGTAIISSGPDFESPDTSWGVQARVDNDGQENRIFASALCLDFVP